MPTMDYNYRDIVPIHGHGQDEILIRKKFVINSTVSIQLFQSAICTEASVPKVRKHIGFKPHKARRYDDRVGPVSDSARVFCSF